MEHNQPTPNQLTDHHVTPKSRGGSNGKQNLKQVPNKYHVAFHLLFLNLTPDEIDTYLREVWFKPKKPFITPMLWQERNGLF